VPYTANLTPSWGKPPYTFIPIDFPSWLMGPQPTGVISAIPPMPGPVPFTVEVTDANGCSDRRTYTLNVSPSNVSPVPPPPTLPKIVLPTGVGCTPYDPRPLAGVLNSGSLPPGLTVVNGSLVGVPTQCGTFCFKTKIPNPPPCTSDLQEYCITIVLPPLTLQPLAPLQTCVLTSQPLAPPFCIPFTCTVTGTLPAGIAVGNCTLQGIAQPGDYDFCVTAIAGDSDCSITQCYKGSVSQGGGALILSPPILPGGTVGVGYLQAFSTSGGTPSYTYEVLWPSYLPPGLSLSSAGVLSGIPTMPGRFNFTVHVTDAAGVCKSKVYTVVIGPAAVPPPDIPALSQWAMMMLAAALALAALVAIRRAS
jgi:hypothetical protein